MSTISGKSFGVGRSGRKDNSNGSMIRLELSPRGVIMLFLALATIWALIRLWQVIILLVISLLLATALQPFVDWLMQRGLSRGKAASVTALLLLALLALLGFIVVPGLIQQSQAFSERLPSIKSDIADQLRQRGQLEMATNVERFQFRDIVQRQQVVNYSQRVLQLLFAVVTVIFMTIYILIDARRIERFFFFMVPDQHHEHIHNLLPALRTTVGGFIRGQVLTSAVISVYTFAVLFALGVPNALALAVLAGIADIIPLIGAFIAVGPATLAALAVSTTTGVLVLAALLLYQQFEDRFLVPRVYGNTLRLPTIAVFLAVLIGAKLMGIIGAVLALPAAAAIRVFIMYTHSVRQGRIEPVAPEDELFAPDEVESSPATAD